MFNTVQAVTVLIAFCFLECWVNVTFELTVKGTEALSCEFTFMDLEFGHYNNNYVLCLSFLSIIFQETKQHIPPKQDKTLMNIQYNYCTLYCTIFTLGSAVVKWEDS